MNQLLVNTIALVTVFSMPASAAPGSWFRDVPEISRNTEANPEQRQSIEERSQSRDATDQVNDPELH
jgi:hypothetical protein